MKKILLLLSLTMGLNFSGSLFAASSDTTPEIVAADSLKQPVVVTTNTTGADSNAQVPSLLPIQPDATPVTDPSTQASVSQPEHTDSSSDSQSSSSSSSDSSSSSEADVQQTHRPASPVDVTRTGDASGATPDATGTEPKDPSSSSDSSSSSSSSTTNPVDQSSSTPDATGADSQSGSSSSTATPVNTDDDDEKSSFIAMFNTFFNTGSNIRTGARAGWVALTTATGLELVREAYVEYVSLRTVNPRNVNAPRLGRTAAFFKAFKNVLIDIKKNTRNHKLLLFLGTGAVVAGATDAGYGLAGVFGKNASTQASPGKTV